MLLPVEAGVRLAVGVMVFPGVELRDETDTCETVIELSVLFDEDVDKLYREESPR